MAKKEYIDRPIIPFKEENYYICTGIIETQGKVNREEGENSKAQKGIKIVIMNEKNNDEIIINTSEHIGKRDDKGNITYSEVNNQEIKR